MSWLATIPLLLFAVVLAFGPGYAMGWALRVPVRLRVFYAPLLTFALVAVSAIVLGKTGIPWSLISFVPVAAVLVAAAAGVMHLVGRRWPSAVPDASSEAAENWAGNTVPLAWPVIGAVLGGFLTLHATEDMVFGPEAFSQTLDNSYHMNAIRWIQEHGDASSLTMGAVSAADQQPAFYPAGWHDFVYLIYNTTGTSIATATIVMILLVAGIIWPCSLVAMCLSIPHLRRLQALAIPALTCGFFAFPGLLLFWGVLFPNLLGYALLPAFVALLSHMIQLLARREYSFVLSLSLTILVGLGGLALVHPNAVVSAAVFAVPMLLGGVVQVLRTRGASTRERLVGTGVLVALIAGCVAAWSVLRPSQEASELWTSIMSEGEAVYQFLFLGLENANPLGGNFAPAYLVGFLALWGVGYLLYKRRNLWLIGSWMLVGYMWIVAASVPRGDFRLLMVGPWYTDHFRLAALVVFPSVLLAGIGLGGAVEGLFVRIMHYIPREKHAKVAPAMMGAAMVLVLAVAGLSSRTPAMHDATLEVAKRYQVTPTSDILNQDEMNVINEIPKIVPKGDTIVNNPWDGSAYIYALADRHLTSYHFEFQTSPKYAAILNDLKDARTNPEVCREVNEYKAHWYVHLENQGNFGPSEQKNYAGLVAAIDSDVLTPVYSSGPMTLYRISACDNN
ncbi:MAG: helicase [Rothia mucilaginosa]|uniref:Helicase n=1 Tax=Rothia mucilaginosa TaxID=43675 RepID=A0A930LY87_9MICC|nr:helicase [Rothia mucilaginosa]